VYDPATWGQGCGYEALGLWTDYLFSTLPWLKELVVETWTSNHAMRRIAVKIGYTLDSWIRSHDERASPWLIDDTMSYEIASSAWAALYPQGFAAHLHRGAT
jgi:RimJ/RimL family protein N-acetyltransferase